MNLIRRGPKEEPCCGPNHGNLDALPKGFRIWKNGNCISLTQVIEDGPSSQMLFCSADCMCDWHGAACALEQNHADKDFEIPGAFLLCWISEVNTSLQRFNTFEDFTRKVGEYQQRMLILEDIGALLQPPQDFDFDAPV